MSVECSECERDARGGHDPSCSRFKPADHAFVTDAYALLNSGECVYTELDGEQCCLPAELHVQGAAS